jgi:signal transduction histidine kinase
MTEIHNNLSLQQLRWFIRLRWAAVLGGLIIIGVGAFATPLHLSLGTLLSCLLVLGLLNGYYQNRLGRWSKAAPVPENLEDQIRMFFHLQMILDLAVLTFMLAVSGGTENPLFFFYLFHLAISAILFSGTSSLGYALVALLLPWLMYLFREELNGQENLWPGFSADWDLWLKAVLAGYSVTVAGIWFFLTRLASDLRAKQEALEEVSRKLFVANENLKQVDVYKNQFLRQVVFQLKGPAIDMDFDLSAIEQALPKRNEKTETAIQTAKKRVWALLELIDDLVWLSKTEVEQMPFKKETVDVYEVLLKRVQSHEAEARRKGLDLQLHGDPQIRLKADKEALDRVADNLLKNSLKYSEDGKGPILLEFKLMGEWMVLTVEDNGIGIPAKQQKRLFEQFFRATNAKSREKFGTGLGLSIVREILQWHGGKVTVESEPKKGTRVETWWPLMPEGH